MPEDMATRMAKRLGGHQFAGRTIGTLLGAGSSAAVFDVGDGQVIKIFDMEALTASNLDLELSRIERAVELGKRAVPGIVRVDAGGQAEFGGAQCPYLVMARLQGCDLRTHIEANGALDYALCVKVTQKLLEVCEALLELGVVHRDIKPANVMLGPEGKVTLTDLGVLKVLGDASRTDVGNEKPFVGTKRYSPPEFITRTEEATKDAWEAINYYQIGAVAHDIVMGQVIFGQYREPVAKLVLAIVQEQVAVQRVDFPDAFLHFVRCSLTKDPRRRTDLCRQARRLAFPAPNAQDDAVSAAVMRIRASTGPVRERLDELRRAAEEEKRLEEEAVKVRKRVRAAIDASLEEVVKRLQLCSAINEDGSSRLRAPGWHNVVYAVQGTIAQGFDPKSATLLVFGYRNRDPDEVELRLRGVVFRYAALATLEGRKTEPLLCGVPAFRESILVTEGPFDEGHLRAEALAKTTAVIEVAIGAMRAGVEAELSRMAEGLKADRTRPRVTVTTLVITSPQVVVISSL
jgi:hypothetical protein